MFLNIMLLGGSADIAAVAVQSSFSDHIAELISDLGIYFGYAVFEQFCDIVSKSFSSFPTSLSKIPKNVFVK